MNKIERYNLDKLIKMKLNYMQMILRVWVIGFLKIKM